MSKFLGFHIIGSLKEKSQTEKKKWKSWKKSFH